MKPIFPEGTKIVQDDKGNWNIDPPLVSPLKIRERPPEFMFTDGMPKGVTWGEVEYKEIKPGVHQWVISPPTKD